MWFSFFLYDQTEPFDFPAMLGAGGYDIDPGGVDTVVTQNIRQLGNILFNAVECPGEELSQIMGKDFRGIDPGGSAQPLHLRPDVTAVYGLSVLGDKNRTGFNAAALGII